MSNSSNLRRGNLLLACVVGLLGASAADHPEAVHALAQFLEWNAEGQVQSPEARARLTGEALETWTLPTLGPIQGKPNQVIEIATGSVVARLPLRSPQGDDKDFYFYLVEEGGTWKVSTLRTLSSLAPLYVIRDTPPAILDAEPDGAYMSENVALTLSSDAALLSWHAEHRDTLQQLATQVASDPVPAHRVGPLGENESTIASRLRALGVSSAERLPTGVRITVGGITDNTVGFFYIESGTPPPISPDGFIWVEPLGGGWHLFTTT